MKHIGILYGGGLDSTAIACLLSSHTSATCHLIHVDYGQKAAERERTAMHTLAGLRPRLEAHTVTATLPRLNASIMTGTETIATDQQSAKLDGRNFMLAGLTAPVFVQLGVQDVVLGLHAEPADTPMLDAKSTFPQALNTFLPAAVSAPLRFHGPFAPFQREHIIHAAAVSNPWLYHVAHTCYEATPGGCMQCSHCRQLEAIRHSHSSAASQSEVVQATRQLVEAVCAV